MNLEKGEGQPEGTKAKAKASSLTPDQSTRRTHTHIMATRAGGHIQSLHLLSTQLEFFFGVNRSTTNTLQTEKDGMYVNMLHHLSQVRISAHTPSE